MLLDIFVIVLLFFLFGISHSILASEKVKRRITDVIGVKIAFYRMFYNISSFIILAAILAVAPHPDVMIYSLSYPYDIVIVALEILSLIGFIIAAKQLDGYEFIGLKQIKRYVDETYDAESLDEISRFSVKGAFKYSRHPIYFFSILFLGLRPSMDLFYLTAYICIVIYFLIGIYFEENRMVLKFGEKYIRYKSSVPMLIPYKFLKRRRGLIETEN